MPQIYFDENQVIFGRAVPLRRFPGLYRIHLESVEGTRENELEGERLRHDYFPVERLEGFIGAVFEWAGGEDVAFAPRAEELVKDNGIQKIREAFLRATENLQNVGRGCQRALGTIKKVRGLGISYGSKILRFIRPDICPVFDSILQGTLPYRATWGATAHLQPIVLMSRGTWSKMALLTLEPIPKRAMTKYGEASQAHEYRGHMCSELAKTGFWDRF